MLWKGSGGGGGTVVFVVTRVNEKVTTLVKNQFQMADISRKMNNYSCEDVRV